MSRAGRVSATDMPHHVVHRGNNRQPVFFDTVDYCRYRACARIAGRRYGCEIHAYVLMTNHVHLLITQSGPDGIARMMQLVASGHARFINRTRERRGGLWEGRYRASLIDSDRYFFACQRYIELNPVRAGIVPDPAEYRWSSYGHNALGQLDECVTEHTLYRDLARDPAARRRAYSDMFRDTLGDEVVSDIRIALAQNRPLVSER